MKYVSMVILITLFSSTMVLAQNDFQRRGLQGPPPPPTPEKVDEMVKELSYELTLTEDQAVKFEEIFKAHLEEAGAMHEEQQKEQREKMDSLRSELEKALSSILNEAQMEKFEEIHPKKQGMRESPGYGDRGYGERGCRGKHHPRPCRR